MQNVFKLVSEVLRKPHQARIDARDGQSGAGHPYRSNILDSVIYLLDKGRITEEEFNKAVVLEGRYRHRYSIAVDAPYSWIQLIYIHDYLEHLIALWPSD